MIIAYKTQNKFIKKSFCVKEKKKNENGNTK